MNFETLTALRGLSAEKKLNSPFIGEMPHNRQPKDLPIDLHNRADQWFYEKFGVRYRSQAIFITGSEFVARSHAYSDQHIVRIIPLSGYRFCWSPLVKDLFSFGNSSNGATIEEYLASGDYRQDGLEEALSSGNEIMLQCDQFIAIPTWMLSKKTKPSEYRGLIITT